MKREMLVEARKWFLLVGCTAMGSAAFVGSASNALGAAPVSKAYAEMNCEQLGAEYTRLDHSLTAIDAGAGSGAAEGVAAATKGMPGGGASSEATARGLDRAIDASELLHRMGLIREVHRGKNCTTKLETSKPAAIVLADEISLGEVEYKNHCAGCHGPTGKGNGWFGKYMKESPPSLVNMKKSNGGAFPFDHVYEVIDGRKEVQVHGPRDMPIWGRIYHYEADKKYETHVGERSNAELTVRAKIRALVDHIERFQE